ncbi:hypothetical protein H0H10_17750 [Streptomyces sp. TRM S81-3]|uniref:Secreted protein n=1 Tax=Streptomyces griseicoloratus TaxID=2752516 RepID=A0A926QQL7_9ACTN|nr:hypothetical protein [Streptomyces griseicoloratus]MBD0420969.1 hypothetical protein [Streptomyces griseicoloratus]
MRFSRVLAAAPLAVVCVLLLPYEAMSHARVATADTPAEDFGAACRVRVDGSRVTAYCHNPYPETDRVSLHVECARWWDLDTDGAAVEALPAQTVRLTGRCWKEVASAWVSHGRVS